MSTFRDLDLIGLHGKMNAGKDATFAAINISHQYTEIKFAEPIKQAATLLFGWSRGFIEDRVAKEQVDPYWGFSPRFAMQTMGTEWARKMLRDDIWLKVAEKQLVVNRAMGRKTVVSDVRFDNEAKWILDQGGVVIEIIDPDTPIIPLSEQHASERGISSQYVGYRLMNPKSSGLHALVSSVSKLLDSEVTVK